MKINYDRVNDYGEDIEEEDNKALESQMSLEKKEELLSFPKLKFFSLSLTNTNAHFTQFFIDVISKMLVRRRH